MKGPAPNPCESCPYRRDVPSGVWAVDEYQKLLQYDEETFNQPAGLFQCHQNGSDSASARLCAGWVACHGYELLALRLAVAAGRVDPDVFDYTTTVPIFKSGAEAAEHGVRDVVHPSRAAVSMGAKIVNTRTDMHT